MKNTTLSVLAYPLLLTLALLPASQAAAQEVTRTPWQMHKGQDVLDLGLSAPLPHHGLPEAYGRANIPSEGDAGWGPAPNPETIGLQVPSIIPGPQCRRSVDYSYFQSFVTVPPGTEVTAFEIAFSGMDDGSRITIFNSENPDGAVVADSDVRLGQTRTVNLSENVIEGRNRVVITQVDDCPGGNNLQSAQVVLNSQTIAPTPEPPIPPEEPEDKTASCTTSSQTHNAWGDVHMNTPDRLVYDWQAAGEFVLAQSTDGNVVVQTRQEKWGGNSRVAVNTAVAMNVAGDTVGIYVKPNRSLYINDELFELAPGNKKVLNNGGSIELNGNIYTVRWPDSCVTVGIRFNGSYMDVGVNRTDNKGGTFEGLLGNFDGDRQNDMHVRNGEVLDLPANNADFNRFGNSWRITANESLFRYESGSSTTTFNPANPEPEELFSVANLDSQTKDNAEQQCQAAGVTAPHLLEGCILDVATTGDPDFANSAKVAQEVEDSMPTTEEPLPAVNGQYPILMPQLLGHWTFEQNEELVDRTENWGTLTLDGEANISDGMLDVNNATTWAYAREYTGPTIRDKTLVSWVEMDSLDVRSGSILTIDSISADNFDAIVYAERVPLRWMAGSSFFHRTQDVVTQDETVTGGLLQLAIAYKDMGNDQVEITLCHNGDQIGQYTSNSMTQWEEGDAEVIFGKRHTGSGTAGPGEIDARIEEARIYADAMTCEEVSDLSPME